MNISSDFIKLIYDLQTQPRKYLSGDEIDDRIRHLNKREQCIIIKAIQASPANIMGGLDRGEVKEILLDCMGDYKLSQLDDMAYLKEKYPQHDKLSKDSTSIAHSVAIVPREFYKEDNELVNLVLFFILFSII